MPTLAEWQAELDFQYNLATGYTGSLAVQRLNLAPFFPAAPTNYRQYWNFWSAAVEAMILCSLGLNFQTYNEAVRGWMNYISNNMGGGGTLTDINNAMKAGTYTEIAEFLSILWAFQQIMFDQPFHPEAYTALVNQIRT